MIEKQNVPEKFIPHTISGLHSNGVKFMKKKLSHNIQGSSGQYRRRTGTGTGEMRWLSINGQPVEDVFDYRYLMNDEFVTLLYPKEEWRGMGTGSRKGI